MVFIFSGISPFDTSQSPLRYHSSGSSFTTKSFHPSFLRTIVSLKRLSLYRRVVSQAGIRFHESILTTFPAIRNSVHSYFLEPIVTSILLFHTIHTAIFSHVPTEIFLFQRLIFFDSYSRKERAILFVSGYANFTLNFFPTYRTFDEEEAIDTW